ncbi:MAG: hypothetical protein EBR82_56970, partial [Caulobacteraceae bacterium]|nr:hypothetical protein [Caulobacteraceae bacterium]
MKLMNLAKHILGMDGETHYNATFAGGIKLRIALRDDGSVVCDAGDGRLLAPGYIDPQGKAWMLSAKWEPPLPPEVRRAIWPTCDPGDHRPRALAIGPFQRCQDCGAQLQADRECPACYGTGGVVNGTGDACEECGGTGQLGW